MATPSTQQLLRGCRAVIFLGALLLASISPPGLLAQRAAAKGIAQAPGTPASQPLPPITLPADALPPARPTSAQIARLAAGARAPAVAPLSQGCAVAPTITSIDLTLLVIAADGTEADLPAIRQTLDYLGLPYTLYIATQHANGLTATFLANGTHGYYQGIILTTGALAYSHGGTSVSALSAAEWQTLWNYQAASCTRLISWYTYPTADYGFQPSRGAVMPITAPYNASFTAAGAQLFGNYANTATPLGIQYAYTYTALPLNDGATTPLLSDAAGNALAVVHTTPTGRQTLALTFDSNASLIHTLVLGYGLVNWVTKGLFLGERHTYLTPQIDDVYIEDDEWLPTTRCGTATDATGATYRINGSDFKTVLNWQTATHAKATSAGLRLNMVFNGLGSTGTYVTHDTLTPEITRDQAQFNWINHTYDHLNLSDPTTPPATFDAEIQQNDQVARSVPLTNFSADDMVTPDISGLTNTVFLKEAVNNGLHYLVTDTSIVGYNNPSPNAGIYNVYQPSILMIPRHPVNLYYNVTTPAAWLAEDNCLYPSGAYGHVTSYQQLLDRVSSQLLLYLLNGDVDPLMFHQANLRAYDGKHTLLTDLLDATLAKYNSLFTLPLQSPTMDQLGQIVADRMRYNGAGATASVTQDASGNWLTLNVQTAGAATVPVTGLRAAGATTYGGQPIAHLAFSGAGQQRFTLLTYTVALTSSANPATPGQQVSFTATVAPTAIAGPVLGPATGTVTFKDGAATLGTAPLNAAGVATFSTSSLGPGTHSITAVYGSGNTSPSLAQVIGAARQLFTWQGTAGWDTFSLPLQPDAPVDAATFLQALRSASGGTTTALYLFSNGAWSQSVIDVRGSIIGHTFTLQPGAGYLLYTDRSVRYQLTGTIPATLPGWTLARGWNVVGVMQGSGASMSASAALTGVLRQGGGTTAILYSWSRGAWSAPLTVRATGATSGPDFTLQPGQGYLLYTDHAATYRTNGAVPASGGIATRQEGSGARVPSRPQQPAA